MQWHCLDIHLLSIRNTGEFLRLCEQGPFGCLVWYWGNPRTPDLGRAKLAPTSIEGMFLGYKIRETPPPKEAFISTAAPIGDPNSLLKLGTRSDCQMFVIGLWSNSQGNGRSGLRQSH